MKKIIISIVIVFSTCIINAQSLGPELGIRLGVGTAIDAVIPLGINTRIHADMGWEYQHSTIKGVLNIQLPIVSDKWVVYAGTGMGLRSWYRYRSEHIGFSCTSLIEAGIEYEFSKPYSIGIDWSSDFDFIKFEYDNYGSICLRYRFNN